MNHARVTKQMRINPTFHRDFFHKIDTKEKAYWLGYLFNVGRVREDGYFFLSRSLNQDFEALARFSMDVNLSSDIYKHNLKRVDGVIAFITYYISFTSKEFADGFYGYFPKGDSYINLDPLYPNISPAFNRDFIRGMFDSYSSVIKQDEEAGRRYTIRIDGPHKLLTKVQQILKEEAEINSFIVERDTVNRFDYALTMQSKLAVPDLILYLYGDVKRYNTRKYEQLMDLFYFLYN